MSDVKEAVRLRAIRALPGGITRSTVFVPPHPPYAVRGVGSKIIDVEGHEAIDANNNYTSLIHGHAHPDLVRVAIETISNGSAFGLPTPAEVDLAETLSSRTGLENWRFCNSGTEAVMMAMRCARAHTGRDVILRFAGSYHGTYDHVVESTAPGIPITVNNSVIVVPQGDEDAFKNAMQTHGRDIAAVLIDLMPNRAGLRPASTAFVELLRQQTTHHGALLIIDEVITFRIAYGGMSSVCGVTPDIMVVGKIIGGGFPAGGIGGSSEVLAAFIPGGSNTVSWGGTFSANPVTMNVGRVALELFDRSAIAQLNSAGDEVRNFLNASGIVATGVGSLLRLTFNRQEDWWNLYDRGLLVCTNGLVALSTAMSAADVDRIGKIVLETFGQRAS
jgi:glutamate-1-semialdehyde 2,1-aminomutase